MFKVTGLKHGDLSRRIAVGTQTPIAMLKGHAQAIDRCILELERVPALTVTRPPRFPSEMLGLIEAAERFLQFWAAHFGERIARILDGAT